jgi:hypothetical protein
MSNMYRRTKNDPRLTKKRKLPIAGYFRRMMDSIGRRGTDPWRVNLTKKSIPWARILAPILLISIPLFVIMAVDNTLMRLPDVYKYHFLSSEVLNERMVAASEEDVAQLISDFLIYKTDKFQMKEDLEYMPADVFTQADGAMIRDLRSMLDIQAIVGIAMLLLTVLMISFYVHQKERELLLKCFYFSLPIFGLIKIIEIVLMLFDPLRNRVFGIPTVEAQASDDLIPALLDGSFFKSMAIAETVMSLILLGVIYYIILNLAGRKTTFRR